MASDFPGAFTALREILKKHSGGMTTQADTPADYTVVTPAVAAGEISDIRNGVLLAKSAAARVTTTAVCDAGSEYTLDLSLTQNVKKSNTGGSSQRSFVCTGHHVGCPP